jgi:hypothetical protein
MQDPAAGASTGPVIAFPPGAEASLVGAARYGCPRLGRPHRVAHPERRSAEARWS